MAAEPLHYYQNSPAEAYNQEPPRWPVSPAPEWPLASSVDLSTLPTRRTRRGVEVDWDHIPLNILNQVPRGIDTRAGYAADRAATAVDALTVNGWKASLHELAADGLALFGKRRLSQQHDMRAAELRYQAGETMTAAEARKRGIIATGGLLAVSLGFVEYGLPLLQKALELAQILAR